MSNPLWDLIEGAGYILDTPGALTRGLLAGRPGERVGGRDLLESWGVLDKNQEGLDAGDVAGFGAEMLLDPLNLVGGGALRRLMASRKTVQQSNQGSKALRAMGAFPEELIKLQHPSMLDEAGRPRKVYHGTSSPHFDKYDIAKADEGALYGKGVYTTMDPGIASEYVEKTGPVHEHNWSMRPEHEAEIISRAKDLGVLEHLPEDAPIEALRKSMNHHFRMHGPHGNMTVLDVPDLASKLQDDLIVHKPGAHVRMHYADVRSPLNMDDYSDVPVPFDQISEVDPSLALRLRELNKKTGYPSDDPVAMSDIIKTLSHDGRDSPGFLKGLGFDAITHEGGSIMGNKTHQVVIGLDPDQFYAPYIAPALQSEPSLRNPLAALLAQNLIGRSHPEYR